MEGKIPAAIRSITLDGRTYHNVALSPTLINFFYGKNGTGKTTIAQNIRDGIGIAPIPTFKATYESATGSLLAALRENLNNTFPHNDFTKYKEILDTITALIELNRKTLSEKISSPGSAITLEGTDDKICELNTIITDLNATIKENNDILASRQAKQDECTSAVWKHMAFINANDITSYHSSVKTAQAEIKN